MTITVVITDEKDTIEMTKWNLDQKGDDLNGDKWWWVITAVLAIAGPGRMLWSVVEYYWGK